MVRVFTSFPGETEAQARERLALIRGDLLRTEDEREMEERAKAEAVARKTTNH